MNKKAEYEARCFCGAVEFALNGKPELMAFCHCHSCRQWSAGPVSAFTLWKPGNLSITSGQEHVTGFDKNPGTEIEDVVSVRKWCKVCGGHLFTEHPLMGVVDVPAVVIEGLDFEPKIHVHYQETVHPMVDGLVKFRDLPEEAGGSGETLSEQA